MLKFLFHRLTVLVLATGTFSASEAADFNLKANDTVVAPSTRGAANTTYFGWDDFGAISEPIDDTTPDIGTVGPGARFRTLGSGDHTSGSGNYYSYSDTPNEEVTVVTNGTPGVSGKTTVIAQIVTLFGGFPAPWLVGEIDGVKPVAVVQGINSAGRGQLWAMWELPGNAETYTFVLSGTPGTSAYSFDKIVIDTAFDPAGAAHPDNMLLAPPADFTLNKESSHVVPTTRGSRYTTHFGWDHFEDPAAYPVPGTSLNDDTPDLTSAMTPAGVRFESLHSNKNRASTGNYYSGHSALTAIVDERVTVVTDGVVGATGKTTILAQLVGTGVFPNEWTFSEINGVTPEVVAGVNAGNKGQVWVKWELPGNQLSYQFTLGSTPNQAHMSFDKIEIDTWFDADGKSHPDSMILTEATALAHIMDQASGPVIPSSRGGRGTTYFGWDTFGTPGPAVIINDTTPDIGSDSTGLARFRTTNGETHQLAGGGNIYFLAGTLAEEVTVPTDGVPGSDGFTTVILQISSSSSGFGGSTFAGPITLSSINGVTPTVVQASSSAAAQLWAKWVVPGNQPSYTIEIAGPPNQAHFSIDQVVVDTKYSRYEGVGDTMQAQTVEITTESLADVIKGVPYAFQLEAAGGTSPFTWALAAESVLPQGLTLSSGGLLSGTPTEVGEAIFTVEVTEGDGYQDTQVLSLMVRSSLEIVTSETLPTAVVGRPYEVVMSAVLGLAPYNWEITSGALPDGLTMTAAGVISGTPVAAGEELVTIQVTDGEDSTVQRTFSLPVSATLLAPVMNPLPAYMTIVGAEISGYKLSALNYPAGFDVSGLPKGLNLNRVTGEISGRVATAGVYSVQARAFNAASSSSWVSGMLVVKALPVGQFGSFTGWSERALVNGSLGSLIALKTTPTGAFTVSVRTGKGARSARGFLRATAPQVQAEVAGGLLTLSIDPLSGEVTGSHAGAAVSGWRAVWDKNLNPASGREGYYSVAIDLDASHASDDSLPKGVGFATFTVPANGVLRVRGKTADGQNIVSSGAMGPNGEIAIYAAQYANKGSVLGQWELAEDADGVFSDNTISGELSWQKPETRGRVYAGAFGPIGLEVTGRYLAQSAKGQTVLGLPGLGQFALEFSEGGIGESETVADVMGIEWTEKHTALMPATGNAAGVKLRINKNTGAMNGTFTLTESTPRLVRKNVKFFGQVVRTADEETRAVGYFLLPQIPVGVQKPNNSPIHSGAVYVAQPAL